MLRRLKILLFLFVLLLLIDRWTREQRERSEELSAGAEGGSFVLEKDAPIIVTEESALTRSEDSPMSVAEATGLQTAEAMEETSQEALSPVEETAPGTNVSETGGPEATTSEQDDLTVIEGIGSRITELLYQAGIRTFEQLARSDLEQIRGILNKAGLTMMDPTTWMEQAELAARDDWEGLKELQSQLNAGRRR